MKFPITVKTALDVYGVLPNNSAGTVKTALDVYGVLPNNSAGKVLWEIQDGINRMNNVYYSTLEGDDPSAFIEQEPEDVFSSGESVSNLFRYYFKMCQKAALQAVEELQEERENGYPTIGQ